MTRNLADAGTGVLAERLNTALAPVLGERDGRSAKQRIQAAVRAEPQDPDALAAALAAEVRTGEDVELPEGVAASELTGWIRGLLDPRGYLGAAPQLCERAAARHDERKRR
ncbi:hypothetical protein D8M38_12770 [Kocuria sp. HSID17582]|nr:hypothetical protein D8M38_12770 [Kocuria sp. HSID17582]